MRTPPLKLWLFWLLLLAPTFWMQFMDPFGDRGMTNVFSMLLLILGTATTWIWFVFFSAYAKKARGLVFAGTLVALVGGSCLAEFTGFSGLMIPRFSYRFRAPGPALPEVVTAPGADTARTAPSLKLTSPTDFPGFLGRDRLGTVNGVQLARDWDTHAPELLWRQDVGFGWSGFAIVNGVAVTIEEREGRELVIAYALESGAILWTHVFGEDFAPPIGGPGPRSTPMIAEGAVVALGARAKLVCLEGSTGELRWSHDLLAEYGIDEEHESRTVAYGRSNSPLVVEGKVVVPVGGNADEGKQAGLAAFELETGALLWEGPARQVSYSSPTLANVAGVEQILIVNEASASGHDPETGALLWEYPWPGRTSNDANCSQVLPVGGNRVLLSKGYGQGAALLSLASGVDGALTAALEWHSRRLLRTKFTNVVLHGEHLYGLSDGILECGELETGKRVWKGGRYGHGQLLLVDDLLLVLSEEGELILVEATHEREAHELGRIQAIEGRTWNNLALSNDLLAVRNAEEAAVYRLALAAAVD